MIRAFITWKTRIICDLLLLLCRNISTTNALYCTYTNIEYMKLLSSVTKIIKKTFLMYLPITLQTVKNVQITIDYYNYNKYICIYFFQPDNFNKNLFPNSIKSRCHILVTFPSHLKKFCSILRFCTEKVELRFFVTCFTK